MELGVQNMEHMVSTFHVMSHHMDHKRRLFSQTCRGYAVIVTGILDWKRQKNGTETCWKAKL